MSKIHYRICFNVNAFLINCIRSRKDSFQFEWLKIIAQSSAASNLLNKMHACEWHQKIQKIMVLYHTLKAAFTYSYMINLIMYESKDVAELEVKELHNVSSDVFCVMNWKKKKGIVNFKTIIYNTGIIVLNLQKIRRKKRNVLKRKIDRE